MLLRVVPSLSPICLWMVGSVRDGVAVVTLGSVVESWLMLLRWCPSQAVISANLPVVIAHAAQFEVACQGLTVVTLGLSHDRSG